jgi:predicted transcriptional regulator
VTTPAGDLEKVLGPLEAEVVRAIWAAGEPVSVGEVLEQLNRSRRPRLAYTTVMTVMSRLAKKGILSRRSQGRGYVYESAVRNAAEIAVRSVVRDFGEAAIASFVAESRADPRILRRLARLLREPE